MDILTSFSDLTVLRGYTNPRRPGSWTALFYQIQIQEAAANFLIIFFSDTDLTTCSNYQKKNLYFFITHFTPLLVTVSSLRLDCLHGRFLLVLIRRPSIDESSDLTGLLLPTSIFHLYLLNIFASTIDIWPVYCIFFFNLPTGQNSRSFPPILARLSYWL